MVQYQELGITTRHFISNGNLHRNSKTKPLLVGGHNNWQISFFLSSFLRNAGRKMEKGKSDKMICRRCFNLSLIYVFWLSANAIALGQISEE